MVYNIKEAPFQGAIRVGKYKLIWASRTSKNFWYEAQEEMVDPEKCRQLQKNRTASSNLIYTETHGLDSAEIFYIGDNGDQQLWDEAEELENIQRADFIAEERSLLLQLQAQEEEGDDDDDDDVEASRSGRAKKWKQEKQE